MCAGALVGCSSASSRRVFYGEKTARMSRPGKLSAAQNKKKLVWDLQCVLVQTVCVCVFVHVLFFFF